VTGGSLHPDLSAVPGYLLAAAAALTWAAYSLMTKRLPPFGSGAVGAFCLAAGVLSLGVYAAQAGPGGFSALRAGDWPFLILLGAGPMGAAFFLWDAALKRGDPRVIGALSYVTPLLSTLALTVVAGRALSPVAGAAMFLIIAGASIGSLGGRRTILKEHEGMGARNRAE
jgi:drug/metabolite transporter (DMT)-like permease